MLPLLPRSLPFRCLLAQTLGFTVQKPPAVERRVYTERTERYVKPAPTYREEVRVYRTVPMYTTRVYREEPIIREVPVVREVPVIRQEPYYWDHRVEFLPPAPHRCSTDLRALVINEPHRGGIYGNPVGFCKFGVARR